MRFNLTDQVVPQDWFSSTYAKHYFRAERKHLKQAMRQAIGPKVLQVGSLLEQRIVDDLDLPFIVRVTGVEREGADLIADPAFLPIQGESFSTVLLPHVLEGSALPHQVLREAHRVLMHEGYIVITGFNPVSLLGLQNIFYRKAVFNGRYYTVKRVIDWLQLLGFEVVASSMYQYAPLSSKAKVNRIFRFFESVGDRWLPMTGGGYMITARKREQQPTLVGRVKQKRKPKLVAGSATAKLPLNKDTNQSTYK